MNLYQRFLEAFGYKASQARMVTSVREVGKAVATPANYENIAKEGYNRNPYVFRCVNLIAESSSGIRWKAYSKRKGGKPTELKEHAILDLLEKPNPMQAQSQFMESLVSFYCLAGNTYIEAVKPDKSGPPVELWTVRPDRMTIVPNRMGYPGQYIYKVGGLEKVWNVDFVKLQSDILHMKTFNPINDWYGMSPLQAAMYAVDQNNEAGLWNLSLLRNSATPSGVLKVLTSTANPRGDITQTQYDRLRNSFYENNSGSRNARKPLILEGGLDWQSISMSPAEMDFKDGKSLSAQEICMVYGVPGIMLGLGNMTFRNYEEARKAFYQETILPLMDFIRDELNRWLCPAFGPDIAIDYDRNDIEALAPDRDAKFTALQNVNWMTQNEKRRATGQDEKPGWDVFIIQGKMYEEPEIGEPEAQVDPELNTENTEDDPNSQDKKPTKDPAENEMNGEDQKSFLQTKTIRVLNRFEREQSWKRQNARKKRLQENFQRDLEQDFKEMSLGMGKAVEGVQDPKLVEFALLRAVETHIADLKSTLKKHIRYSAEDFGSMIFQNAKSLSQWTETKAVEGPRKFTQFVDAYVQRRSGNAITEIEGTTRKKVKEIVRRVVAENIQSGENNSQLSNQVREEFSSLSKGRSRTIARTEVQMASQQGSLEAAKSLQIPGMVKEWVSIQDDRTRDGDGPNPGHGANHLDMNGVQVELNEKFTVPPDTDMDAPGDPAAGADQVINCRCVLVYNVKD